MGAVKGGVRSCSFLGEPVFIPAVFGANDPKLGKIVGVFFEPSGSSTLEACLENVTVAGFNEPAADWQIVGQSARIVDLIAAVVARHFLKQERNYAGQSLWARGFFVDTVGRDTEVIRRYIQNQEAEDQRVDQLEIPEVAVVADSKKR
jgi:putative transposase